MLTILRPRNTPGGTEVSAHLRWLVRHFRLHWPNTRIMIRGDGHNGRREAVDWGKKHAVGCMFGLSTDAVLAAFSLASLPPGEDLLWLGHKVVGPGEMAGGKIVFCAVCGGGPARWQRRRSGPREIEGIIRDFNRMREPLRRLNDDWARMMTTMSHDFRTPLARLRVRIEMAEGLEDQQTMLDEVDRMNGIIQSFSCYSGGTIRSTSLYRWSI